MYVFAKEIATAEVMVGRMKATVDDPIYPACLQDCQLNLTISLISPAFTGRSFTGEKVVAGVG